MEAKERPKRQKEAKQQALLRKKPKLGSKRRGRKQQEPATLATLLPSAESGPEGEPQGMEALQASPLGDPLQSDAPPAAPALKKRGRPLRSAKALPGAAAMHVSPLDAASSEPGTNARRMSAKRFKAWQSRSLGDISTGPPAAAPAARGAKRGSSTTEHA